MLAILLALASAIGYGGSDFAAGLAARRTGVLMVAFLSQVFALLLSLAVLPLVAARTPSAAALAWGTIAGIGGMSGGLALYAGFRRAAFSVAGPLSAVSGAGLSVVAGVLLGERPSWLSLAGIAVALPAIVLVSLTAAPPGTSRHASQGAWAGVAWGLAAGAGFALLFFGLHRAGSAAGIWPVFSGQIVEVAVLAVLVAVSGGFRAGGPAGQLGVAGLPAITGLSGGGATILYFFATHAGFLAVTAVLTSLYPAITIALARVLAGERLTVARVAGLTLAGLSVSLIAVGGAS